MTSKCRTCMGDGEVKLPLGRRATCPNCDGAGVLPANRSPAQAGKRRRAWRKIRGSLGLCANCEDPVWVDKNGRKHSLCKFHYGKATKPDVEGLRLRRQARRDAGLCTECKDPTPQYVENGKRHSMCQRHFEQSQKRLAKQNKARKAAGKCFCGEKVKPGCDRCSLCLDIENNRQLLLETQRREQNLCVNCGKRRPKENRDRCKVCLKAALARHHERKRIRRIQLERRGQLSRALNAPNTLMVGW